MNELDAIEKLLSWVGKALRSPVFTLPLFVIALILMAYLFSLPNSRSSISSEAPVDKRYRERADASFQACVAAGGVPIMASPFLGGEMRDCKFPPSSQKTPKVEFTK